ncbi:hypothetical protein [uncultured Hyphomicrobium sp.]|uniref:hypothetical protein n=1 Tax=uncultured Hyphomicrobium sp. TaxID=194373 RepID=UPI0025FF3636|nr:hypothetical protein [uncultured Hyphomicrobium sp.]
MGWTNRTVVVIALVFLSGCSSAGSPPVLGLPSPNDSSATTGEGIPSATAALQSILTPQDLVVGTPTEVYTRVARGVLTCWFGADGPLKARYIYHAEAEPASKGGQSEIKIMTRDVDADDPRALRAYRVVILPSEKNTKIELENARLPEPLAARLKTDVERWARDEAGCGEGPVTAGWNAEQAVDAKPATKEKTKKP